VPPTTILTGLGGPFTYTVPAVRVDLPTAGPVPADVPRGNPTGPLSEALLQVMGPYIPWPPASDELDELSEELCFGASVWNATTQSTDPAKTATLLDELVRALSTGVPADDAALRRQVAEIVARKRAMYPDDPRQIVHVTIVPVGQHVEVQATGAWYRG